MPHPNKPVTQVCPTEADLEQCLTANSGTLDAHLAGCAACRKIAEDLSLLSELRSVFGASSENVTARRDAAHDGFPGFSELQELQRGAQGVVYRAIQDETQRVVALKVLLNGAFATQRQRQRFQREVELSARLRHPNIVTVYDSGEHNGNLFYAMEFIDGQRLDVFGRGVVATEGRQAAQLRIVTVARHAADAVGHAHTSGILHRDLKPANILVDAGDKPHILDFGLARHVDASDATQSGEFLGTLRYASPEQACAEPDQIDVRTDVYSLGVILFEAITGSMPYDVDGSLDDVIRNIRDSNPAALSKLASGIDTDLETIVLKCLAKDKLRRYQTGRELADDLGRYLAGDPIDARRDSQLYVAGKLLRRYRYVAVAAATVFVTVCASLVLALVMLQQVSDERDKATTAKSEANRAREAEKSRRLEVEEQQALAEFNAYAASIAASDSALRVNDTSEAALHLQRAPRSQRGFEWWHTHRRLDTSVRTYPGHSSYVEQVIALRTRPWLISIGWDKHVIVWNRETGEIIDQRSLPSHGWSLATNDAETLLASGGWDGKIRVWSLPDLEPVTEFTGPADRGMVLRFSPESDQLAAAFWAFDNPDQENALLVADARTGEVGSTTKLPGRPFWLSYRDGNFLCASWQSTVVVATDGREQPSLRFQVLACSNDGGQTAVLRTDDSVELRHRDGETRALNGHTGPITFATFNFDGTLLATCSRDQTVRGVHSRTIARIGSLCYFGKRLF